MLTIRREQMDVLRESALRAYEDSMVTHLAEFSPALFKTLGTEQLRVAVRQGMAQAARAGFDLQGPVRLYLELMLLFGSRFETDPQYPWAAELLTNQDGEPQMRRAERLYARTMDYRHKVMGSQDAFALQALRNIRAFAAGPVEFAPAQLVPFMLDEIARIYPEKAAYVGTAALSALIRRADQGARNLRFTTPRAIAIVVVLMLAFGHGCGADPFYPWIGRTLKDERITDPAAKAERLENRALIWLDAVLANLGEEATR